MESRTTEVENNFSNYLLETENTENYEIIKDKRNNDSEDNYLNSITEKETEIDNYCSQVLDVNDEYARKTEYISETMNTEEETEMVTFNSKDESTTAHFPVNTFENIHLIETEQITETETELELVYPNEATDSIKPNEIGNNDPNSFYISNVEMDTEIINEASVTENVNTVDTLEMVTEKTENVNTFDTLEIVSEETENVNTFDTLEIVSEKTEKINTIDTLKIISEKTENIDTVNTHDTEKDSTLTNTYKYTTYILPIVEEEILMKIQKEIETETEAATEIEIKSKQEAEIEFKNENETVTEIKIQSNGAETEFNIDNEDVVEIEMKSNQETETEVTTNIEMKSEQEIEVKQNFETETITEKEIEYKQETKIETAENEVITEIEMKSKQEAEIEVVNKIEIESEPETETEVATETEIEFKQETKNETATENVIKSEQETLTKTATEIETKPKHETETETELKKEIPSDTITTHHDNSSDIPIETMITKKFEIELNKDDQEAIINEDSPTESNQKIDIPKEIAMLYSIYMKRHEDEEENTFTSSIDTTEIPFTDIELSTEKITEENEENSSTNQLRNDIIKSISDMVVIDVIEDENKQFNTFVTNPDTADISLEEKKEEPQPKRPRLDRVLKRSDAFYLKSPEDDDSKEKKKDKVEKPSTLLSLKRKLNFNINHETYGNFMLKHIHSSHIQKPVTTTSQSNMFSEAQESSISRSTSSNTFNKPHERFLRNIISKYNVSNFIARQRYKARLRIDYYKFVYQRHLRQPQKDFQDYMKEYEDERYEMNPYLQEYDQEEEDDESITEKKENNKIENEIIDIDENEVENDDDMSEEEDKENQQHRVSTKQKILHHFLNHNDTSKDSFYENQDTPLMEKKLSEEKLLEKKEKERQKEMEKKMNFAYYRQSYDDERNSRNIYLRDDLTQESFNKRQPHFSQKELNKMIFREMQKRNFARQTYNREHIGERLRLREEKERKNEYYHFQSEDYLFDSPQERVERELRDMHEHQKELIGRKDSSELESLVINIKEEEDEEGKEDLNITSEKEYDQKEDEKKKVIDITPRPKKKVSFKLVDEKEIMYGKKEGIPHHEPCKNINPLKLKSCLAKNPVNYDRKLYLKAGMMEAKGESSEKGAPSANNTEIIASSLLDDNNHELDSYIGDNFGNYFTGYAYNNFYFFNGKNYHLMSMFNPKMFYREYFSEDNTIRTNDQYNRRLMKLFRMMNLYRSIITTGYGAYELYENLIDENIIKFGARPFILISLFFLIVDLFIAFIKAFPNKIWFLWNVTDWDPIRTTWTVWSLVANHNTILDILPVMINVIIKVYHFRLSQLVGSPGVGSIFNDNTVIPSINIYDLNQVSLVLFVLSLISELTLYALRIDYAILSRSNSFVLAFIVIIKVVLMTVDITTNLLILYEYLVTLGTEIFTLNGMTVILLSVLLFSFIVTLCTNVIVNIPLHYFFLRMGIKIRLDGLFIEYAEQFKEYQYKTQNLNTYNYHTTKLTEETFHSIFNSDLLNHEDHSAANDSSTTQLLTAMEHDPLFDTNYYNQRKNSSHYDENINNKISTLIKSMEPKGNPSKSQNFQAASLEDDDNNVINIDIIGSYGSITEDRIPNAIANKKREPSRIDFHVDVNYNANQPTTSSFNIISPIAESNVNTPKPIISKDLIDSISSSANSSFIMGSIKEKEMYESIDELNEWTSNTYGKPGSADTLDKEEIDGSRASVENKLGSTQIKTIFDDLGSKVSLNKKPPQLQQRHIPGRSTEDFTKANLEIKEEDINEGIYKYYAKTIIDIENKINQLHRIGFKHIIQVALKRAFHPFLIILFIFNIYMLIALYLV